MKKINYRTIAVAIFTLLLGLFSTHAFAAMNEKEKAYYDNYESILEVMEKRMEEAPQTGDATLDFLYEMKPHHEAAVSMSENLLKYGSNEAVKQLAATIIKDQLIGTGEIEALIQKLKGNPQVDKAKEAEYLKAYHKIHDQMIDAMEDVKPSGNIDRDFLNQMIPHHEGAVAMSENILKYTANSEVKKLAQGIITNQQKQIAEMKQLLKTIQ